MRGINDRDIIGESWEIRRKRLPTDPMTGQFLNLSDVNTIFKLRNISMSSYGQQLSRASQSGSMETDPISEASSVHQWDRRGDSSQAPSAPSAGRLKRKRRRAVESP